MTDIEDYYVVDYVCETYNKYEMLEASNDYEIVASRFLALDKGVYCLEGNKLNRVDANKVVHIQTTMSDDYSDTRMWNVEKYIYELVDGIWKQK